eukprot:2462500-Rhodomonas_salina.2
MAVPAAVRRDEDVLLDPACEVAPVYGWDHLLHAVHRDAAPILSGPPIRHVEHVVVAIVVVGGGGGGGVEAGSAYAG